MIEHDILNRVAGNTERLLEHTTEKCTDSVAGLTSFAAKSVSPSRLTDYAQRKVVTMVNDFTDTLPLFERAGFSMKQFDLELGVSPHMTPRFSIGDVPEEEERKILLEEARAMGGSTAVILAALFKAVELKKHLQLGSMELVGINVTISTIPSVRLVFE